MTLSDLLVFLVAAPIVTVSKPLDVKDEVTVANLTAVGGWTDFWVARLCLNMAGFATILVPGYVFIKYVQQSNYAKATGMYQYRHNSESEF